MIVLDSLKINRFTVSVVKRPRELVGIMPSTITPYPGNTLGNVGYAVNVLGSKLQTLALGQEIESAAARAAAGGNPNHDELHIDVSKL